MFTFETLVDTYTKGAKAAIAYVQPEAFKTALLDLTDKQAEFAKSFGKQVEQQLNLLVKMPKKQQQNFSQTSNLLVISLDISKSNTV